VLWRASTRFTVRHSDSNKKCELMLTRRAIAYSSSCSQVVLVYFSAITAQFTFEVYAAAKNRKNH